MRYLVSWGLLAIVSLLASPAGSCQEPASHEFFPLEVGNVWIHQYSVNGAGYRTTEVTGTTVHEGHPVWLVQVEYEPFAGTTGLSATCAFRVTDDDLLITAALEGDVTACRPMARSDDIVIDLSAPPINEQKVWIAGAEHTLLTRRYSLSNAFHGFLASEVGLATSYPWMPSNFPNKHLVYAKIGDSIIGIHPNDYEWRTYNPVVVSHEWIYRFTANDWQGSSATYRHHKVLGLETGPGGDVFQVELRVLDDGGELISAQVCTVTRTAAGVDVASGPSPCATYPGSLLGDPYSQLSFRQYGTSHPINLNDFGTREIIRYAFSVTGVDSHQTWARDLGLVQFRRHFASGPGSGHSTSNLTLLWARIDGVEYGQVPPVLLPPVQLPPRPPSITELELYPNPLTRSRQLHLEVPGADCHVGGAIYDVLGRRVLTLHPSQISTEPCRLGLDLSVLPPGVFILRLHRKGEIWSRRISVPD